MKESSFINLDDKVSINNSDLLLSSFSKGGLIQLISNKKMIFEGKYKIIEYSDVCFKISSGKKTIVLNGSDIKVSNITADSFSVVGNFTDLLFE